MSELVSRYQLPGVLSDYFTLESHLAASRVADAYSALHKERGMTVCLWMSRKALPLDGAALDQVLQHLQGIQDLHSQAFPLLEFGVDQSGVVFAVLPTLDGMPVTALTRDSKELERRWISCIKLVDRLHSENLVCGNLSASSFWLARSGDVIFTGVLGGFSDSDLGGGEAVKGDFRNFIAPEQRVSSRIEKPSDVYAMGVLGYYLFTGEYPFNTLGAEDPGLSGLRPISEIASNAPAWADEVVQRCLSSDVGARFGQAAEILKGIVDGRQRVAMAAGLPVNTKRELILKRPSGLTGKDSLVDVPPIEEEEEESVGRDLFRPSLLIVAGLIFCFSIFVAWRLMARNHLHPDIESAAVSNPGPNQEDASAGSLSSNPALVAELSRIETLAKNDDPLAHNLLVLSAMSAKTDQIREAAEMALVDRARRLGAARSAEQARQWLRANSGPKLPPGYEALLKALDVNMPSDVRDGALREAYANNPRSALRFAAALALDSKDIKSFQIVMSQLIGDALAMPDAAKHSALALILAHSELALVYGEDVLQRYKEIPDGDLEWLLKILAERNDVNVRTFADLAVERDALPPLRRMFLTLVKSREDLPADVLKSVLKAGAGALTVPDLAIFGHWIDGESEKLLLAICADSNDSDVRQEAFEIVAAKSLTLQPSAALIDWVRRNHWAERRDFAQPIGVIANRSVMSHEALADALGKLDKYASDSRFVNILLDVKDPQITSIVLDRYAGQLGPAVLFNLLLNSEAEVRKRAVLALKGVNDITALRVILDRYQREKDPEVRKVYRETFWMLKNKED